MLGRLTSFLAVRSPCWRAAPTRRISIDSEVPPHRRLDRLSIGQRRQTPRHRFSDRPISPASTMSMAAGSSLYSLIDPVPARGQTTQEFAHRVEAVLRQKLLRNPVVTVEISQYRPFFILGEVNTPGQYAYVNGMTVKTAAAIAGGFTYRASTDDVVITRHIGPRTVEGYAALNAPVMPGDTVQVRERIF